MKKFREKSGQEHGLMETLSNAVPDHGFKNLSEKNRKVMLDRKKNDLELVKVRYQNMDNQEYGVWEGSYCDYPGEPIRMFRFLHGFEYEIPRGLAKKINALGMPIRSDLVDSTGKYYEKEGEIKKTHQLVPVADF